MKVIRLVRERGKKPISHLFLFSYDCSPNMLSEAALSSNHYQRNIGARMEQKMLCSGKTRKDWRIILQPTDLVTWTFPNFHLNAFAIILNLVSWDYESCFLSFYICLVAAHLLFRKAWFLSYFMLIFKSKQVGLNFFFFSTFSLMPSYPNSSKICFSLVSRRALYQQLSLHILGHFLIYHFKIVSVAFHKLKFWVFCTEFTNQVIL